MRPGLLLRATAPARMSSTAAHSAVSPKHVSLPDAICVHCDARFNTRDLEYGVSTLPEALSARWVQLHCDESTTSFLLASGARSSIARAAQSAAAAALRTRLSLTDANAMVGRGSMHVLSTEQARLLLRRSAEPSGALLDVGAGDGGVTACLSPLFSATVATEVSAPMCRRLSQRGFALSLLTEDVTLAGLRSVAETSAQPLTAEVDAALRDGFDCVSLLNVLDRCDTPLTLLRSLASLLKPGSGQLLLAVVLPFRPFVEQGTERRPPAEALHLPPNASFETSVERLWATVLDPLGFRLDALSRVPYLSDGDSVAPVYTLDDALFVLSLPGT